MGQGPTGGEGAEKPGWARGTARGVHQGCQGTGCVSLQGPSSSSVWRRLDEALSALVGRCVFQRTTALSSTGGQAESLLVLIFPVS